MRFTAAGAALLLATAGCGPVATADDNRVVLRFGDDRIVESSGLAVSARHDGVLYTHNDSDDGPVVYAVGPDGATRATLRLAGAEARDWESIAAGTDGDGRALLWIGDIGDNIDGWEEIRVLRIREPARLRDQDVDWTAFRFRYADGRSRDAEALLADPRTGRLYVVSKESAGQAAVYRAPRRLDPEQVNLLRPVADAPAGVTGGTFLPDGSHAVLRGYFFAVVVDRDWQPVARLRPPAQLQGESVAATADGQAVLFGSEGVRSAVWRVPLPAVADVDPAGTGGAEDTGTGEDRPGAAAADPGGQAQDWRAWLPEVDGWMLGVAAALLAALAGFVVVGRRS